MELGKVPCVYGSDEGWDVVRVGEYCAKGGTHEPVPLTPRDLEKIALLQMVREGEGELPGIGFCYIGTSYAIGSVWVCWLEEETDGIS